MKILKIDFENIHSLKGYNTIDFTQPPLSETGIFAITGPTGAGKSTLLDVIMLALYGQIPRMDKKISVEEVEKMGTVLTRGTERAFAQVEYSTKGKMYRSKWYIEKKRKNFDYSMELSELPEGTIIEEKKSEVPARNEEIIGLNYEQFLKSIVLAQGNFAKFLKANPGERTEMLEKITGTEIYRTIGQRAFTIAKEYRQKLSEKQGILETFKILTDDERGKIETQKNEIETKTPEIQTKIKTLNTKLNQKTEILQLVSKINELSKNKEFIQKKIENFKSEAEKLKLHEKLVVYKTDLFEVNELKKKINETDSKLNNNINSRQLLNEKIELTEKDLEARKTSLEYTKVKYQKAEPYILKSQNIFQEIKLEKQNITHKTNNLDKLSSDISNLNTELKTNSEKIVNLQNEHTKFNSWVEQNSALESLKTDYILIEQLFFSYNTAKQKTQNAVNNCSQKSLFEGKGLQEYQSITENRISFLNQEIKNLNINSDDININELKSQLNTKTTDLQIIEKQIELSKTYSEINNKLGKLVSENKEFNTQTTNLNDLRTKTSNELEIIEKKIQELETKYEREQLEKKYEDDRLKLSEEAPCPLCGSTEHPYAQHKHITKPDSTKAEINNQKKTKTDLEKQINRLNIEISSFETSISNNNKLQKEQNELSLKLVQEFVQLNLKLNSNFKINEADKHSDFLRKTKETKSSIELQIKNYEDFSLSKNQLSECNNLLEKITEVFEFNNQAKSKLIPYEEYYKGQKKPDDILKSLKNSYVQYDNILNKLTEILNQINTLTAVNTTKKAQLNDLQTNAHSAKSELELSTNKLLAIEHEYKTIINNHLENLSPEVFLKHYTDKNEQLKNAVNELTNNQTALKTQLQSIEKIIIELENEKLTNNSILENKQNFLLEKLQSIGISSTEDASKHLLSDEDAKNIKTTAQNLNNEQISVNQSISDNKEQLQKLEQNNDDIKIEDLQTELKSLENQQNELNRTYGSLKNQIENDNNQRKLKNEALANFENLNKEAERWEKLNKLIGDSEGKRFASIAQQFTLKELIIIANNHLKNFSNRYILDKAGDIKNNLFVYDTYMGMNKRSVQTLSGGETFLVSLSLALALSDLASRKTKIESLFIDEGFGSLDSDTLDKALVSLERLHGDYNRTIGLISHVPEIKERINTQIILQKDNAGHSKIEII